MGPSIASETRSAISMAQHVARVGYQNGARGRGKRALRGIRGVLDDAVFLLLAVLLLPVVILAVGTPLALLIRFLLEISDRM